MDYMLRKVIHSSQLENKKILAEMMEGRNDRRDEEEGKQDY